MKKILITVPCCLPTSINHYEIMRGEARILHNIGFGLAWIGHDVNIVNSFSDNIIINGDEGGKICLSRNPIDIKYDFEISWSHFTNTFNDYKCKGICVVVYPYEIRLKENVDYLMTHNGSFVTPFAGLTNYLYDITKERIKYLPPLYPIPVYRLGFKEYSGFYTNNLPIDRNIINIFIYVCSWERYLPGTLETDLIVEHIKKIFTKAGKRIKLYISIDSEKTINYVTSISRWGDEIEYIYKYRYDKYLMMIEKMDIFIIKGSSTHTTAGMYDILSLGKPLLYIAWEGRKNDNIITRNPLHTKPENIIYIADDPKLIIEKVDKFLNNMKGFYDDFRECVKDSDFKNWKIIANEIFG